MLVVLASRDDEAARALTARWREQGHVIGLLTCDDLSRAGWCHSSIDPAGSTVVVAGQQLAAREIEGVLTLLPRVYEHELTHLAPTDRAYVAAEMTAFLVAWLSSLPCPVLNRPTPGRVSGPSWRLEHWIQAAAQLGMPVQQINRCIEPPLGARGAAVDASFVGAGEAALPFLDQESNPGSVDQLTSATVTVTVVAARYFGPVARELGEQAALLARASRSELLCVRFSGAKAGSCFLGASSDLRITSDEIADAVLERFQTLRNFA